MSLPRFVELIRVSTRGQADRETPADQRRALDALRRSRPGSLVERIEQQVSGAAAGDARPDLARLAELAALRAFDEVRVRHLDRLTRHEDPLERAAVLSMVRRASAVIVDAGGAVLDPATMGGELTWVVSTLASADERRKILDRTMAAKRRLAAEGRLVHSSPPWGRGFDREAGTWHLTPEAKHYRRLFDLAADGRTLWQVARQLTGEGVPSARGRPWTAQMVGNLLRAPHAAGAYTSHGSTTQIPPIVDAATQAEVLERLRAHDNCGGAHVRHPAMLRKVLVCGVCGSPCHTNRNSSRYAQPYYHCAARDPRCYRAHNIAAVDDAVRARIAAWAKRRGVNAAARVEEDAEALEDALRDAEREVRRAEADEEKIARMRLRGEVSERLGSKMARETTARLGAAEARAEEARARIASAERRAEAAASVESRLAELRRGIDGAGPEEWRELVLLLVRREAGESVAIWPDGRIVIRGALSLDAAGERALDAAAGRGDAAPRSRKGCSVPVLLVARKG